MTRQSWYISLGLLFTFMVEEDCFKIGGLFSQDEDSQIMSKVAFQSAVKEASDKLLEKLYITLESVVVFDTDMSNSYLTQHKVCEILRDGTIGIFGPQVSESSPIVQSICDSKDIPHIQMRYEANQYRGSCSINLYPHPKALYKAYADLVQEWQWKGFVIIYEDNESLMRVSELLKPENTGGATIRLFQLNSTHDNYRPMLRKIREYKEFNILLDCSIQKLKIVLEQAQQIGLMIAEYNYIITCLDLHTINLDQYKYSGANITGFRLINPSNKNLEETIQKWNENGERDLKTEILPQDVLVEAALMHDAVMLFLEAITFVATNNTKFQEEKLSCDSTESWKHGISIINYMKTTEMENGLTGLVKFDHEGFRSNVELQIIELTEDGIQQTGTWNTTDGIVITRSFKMVTENAEVQDLRNATFTVVISMTPPHGMRKKLSAILTGNDQYEGYAVDLIKELSQLSGFKYNFIVQEDFNSGKVIGTLPNKTRIWNGMIGKVLNYEAHMAVADITVTEDRTLDVDFSYQYMDLGIAILYQKPKKESHDLFSFLFPFSTEVWLLVITAYIAVSLLFFIMARLSPYEWTNPYPCIEEPEVLENQFSLSNSFWFTIGALMQQGTDLAPISTSTRVAAGIWWFFTLIMVSSYTANLAAFLTVENPTSPFSDLEGLANQNEISYGCIADLATYKYFRDSSDETCKKIFNFMNNHRKQVLLHSNSEGVKKVVDSKGKYAFFMESTSIEYEKEQNCDLAQIGNLLDNKNYAIAMRKGSWFAAAINRDILILQEQGKLRDLKRKWWKEKYTKNCVEDEKNDAETLNLVNIGGVFLVLIVGVIIAFLVMILELLTHSWNSTREENVPLKQKLIQELKFIIRCRSIKPGYTDSKSLLRENSDTGTQKM